MSPLELRTMIHRALHKPFYGGRYGQIKTIEPLSPVAGDPAVRLRITAPDPLGEDRVHIVTIQEEEAEPQKPKRFKPVKVEDLFRGLPPLFLLEEED